MTAEHDVFFVPSQFPTLGEAIDAVVRPATIMLSPGVYAEEVRILGKEYLVIESTRLSRRGVTLVGGDAASVMAIEGSVVHLSGIEIRSNRRARGISALDSSISLQECVLAGNGVGAGSDQPFGAGMLCAGSSIQTNAVYASDAARGGGIWCERSELRMWRSRVTDNALYAPACEGAGIYFENPIGAQVGGSVITGNGSASGRGDGIFIRGNPERVTIHRNTVVRLNHPADLYIEEDSGAQSP